SVAIDIADGYRRVRATDDIGVLEEVCGTECKRARRKSGVQESSIPVQGRTAGRNEGPLRSADVGDERRSLRGEDVGEAVAIQIGEHEVARVRKQIVITGIAPQQE